MEKRGWDAGGDDKGGNNICAGKDKLDAYTYFLKAR